MNGLLVNAAVGGLVCMSVQAFDVGAGWGLAESLVAGGLPVAGLLSLFAYRHVDVAAPDFIRAHGARLVAAGYGAGFFLGFPAWALLSPPEYWGAVVVFSAIGLVLAGYVLTARPKP
jgi:hypothetical protein